MFERVSLLLNDEDLNKFRDSNVLLVGLGGVGGACFEALVRMGLNNINVDPKVIARTEAIVLSMTPEERRNPDILKASRKIRVAKGSGTKVEDVNRLLKQFEMMQTMMKQMKNGKLKMPF